MHYVTVYCPPNNTEMAENTLRHLKWILFRIFFMDSESKVVVASGLNKLRMKKSDFLENQDHLTPVLPKEEATHKKKAGTRTTSGPTSIS